jgi:hypothetical protein
MGKGRYTSDKPSINNSCTGYLNTPWPTHFFPPIADPSLWQSFRDNQFQGEDSKPGWRERDSWKMDELYGDKAAAAAAFSLFHKYGISHSWSAALNGILLSNDNFRKVSEFQNVSEHLFLAQGTKIHGDAFEVWDLSGKLLI